MPWLAQGEKISKSNQQQSELVIILCFLVSAVDIGTSQNRQIPTELKSAFERKPLLYLSMIWDLNIYNLNISALVYKSRLKESM